MKKTMKTVCMKMSAKQADILYKKGYRYYCYTEQVFHCDRAGSWIECNCSAFDTLEEAIKCVTMEQYELEIRTLPERRQIR